MDTYIVAVDVATNAVAVALSAPIDAIGSSSSSSIPRPRLMLLLQRRVLHVVVHAVFIATGIVEEDADLVELVFQGCRRPKLPELCVVLRAMLFLLCAAETIHSRATCEATPSGRGGAVVSRPTRAGDAGDAMPQDTHSALNVDT